jgi:hypothetical protein
VGDDEGGATLRQGSPVLLDSFGRFSIEAGLGLVED